MTTLYTATGRFEVRADAAGREYPVIMLGGEEFVPEIREMIIWVTLNWRFLELPELKTLYEKRLRELDESGDGADLGTCLNRLLRRGAIASGTAENYDDALYNLFGDLYITPLTASTVKKAAAFLKMTLLDRTPLRTAAAVFNQGPLKGLEREIIAVARQIATTTDELVYHAEESVDIPMRNIILMSVVKLYLHKRIIFERTCPYDE